MIVAAASIALAVTGIAVARTGASAATRPPVQRSPVRALVRILGVLRRDQTAVDRDPRLFAGSSSAGMAPVRSLQRLATTTSWGARVYLVPLVKTSAHVLPLNSARGGLGISVNGRGGGCCETASQVEAGHAYANGVHPSALIMVVPDGVARISVALAAAPGARLSAVAVGHVHSNVAAVRLRRDITAGSGDLITWYSTSGAVVKAFHP
jgi:hypothetical protein